MVAAPNTPGMPTYEVEEPDVSSLVTEDDTPVDSILTEKQERFLTEPLYTSWSGPPPAEDGARRPFAVLANVGLFASAQEPPAVPDVMLSLDVTIPEDLGPKQNRSYFVWRYGKPPEVVVEIVSNREGDELGERLRRYRRIRVAYYVVYDPQRELGGPTLRTFELRGDLYVAIDRPWFEGVGLGLVEWDGAFEGSTSRWLRWCTREGQPVLTGAERAQAAEARAEAAEAQAARLAARLRELGIDPAAVNDKP
jgi:Putative restriction endonuclease